MIDADLADALFLVEHPGWTYDDLQRAPARVVETMAEVEHARAIAHEAELSEWRARAARR